MTLTLLSYIIFSFGIGYYLMTALQWYSYKFERIILHYSKPLWHVFYLVLPLFLFNFFKFFNDILSFSSSILYIIFLILWARNLDKKLVFTARIKRFFILYFIFLSICVILYCIFNYIFLLTITLPIGISLVFSYVNELFLSNKFKNKALDKIKKNPNLKIILITASFGKTSMKNFLFELLKDEFITYKTPRSVNTLTGIIKDINENLQENTQFYIAEAGARILGDIAEISNFLNPHIVIVGQIGMQHIEYFKTQENIRKTKLEALQSSRLEMAFLHSTTLVKNDKFITYDKEVFDIKSSLDGISFKINLENQEFCFSSSLLGEFNAYNLCASILVANYLNIDTKILQSRVKEIKSVEHRLQKIISNGKIIIDDSFNGNFIGMSSSYDLIGNFEGRKVILTPGIIEANDEQNIELGKKIDQIFDLVILTSTINKNTLTKHIKSDKLIILNNKSELKQALLEHTKIGDLILFSNDAPTFI